MFTRSRYWSLSWLISIRSKPFQSISLRHILILSSLLYRVVKKEVYTYKNLFYKNRVLCTDGKEISQSADIDDLKRRITEAVAAVTCDMLRRVWEELDYRFDICRVTRGAHIECFLRCENNFESSPFSLYIARRHMFNITYKINFWKCILLFE
jgi:hypothetical protein